MKQAIQRCRQWLWLLEDGVLVSALIMLMAGAVLQILLRNFFDIGIFWADSFLRVLVLWVAILGAMVATRENRHIAIDAFSRYLPHGFQRVVSSVIAISGALVCAMVSWHCLLFVQMEMDDGVMAFGVVPNWVCELILPFGFAVMALRFALAAFTMPPGDVSANAMAGD